MPSPEYIYLRDRLQYLQTTLPPNALSVPEQDQMKAVAIHQHAACEQYIEQRGLAVATAAYDKFKSSKKIGRVGKYLCVFPFIASINDDNDARKASAVHGAAKCGVLMPKAFIAANLAQIEDLMHIGYGRYKAMIGKNHGISIKYQIKVLASIGVDIGEFDPDFKSSISSLAEFRGEAAHKNLVVALTMPNPATLAAWTGHLIAGFGALDEELKRLPKKPS
ncbi:hypothetical protein J2766_004787 [Agrobacterium tumefaciens]|uniref:RiboL-PSP-HEPN domain-containing protein n=1 Tax=Agrobacterium tumefaciens TaxID=358 RepID=A0AAW8M280_AGRTU|nr:hypothetical protein [Agrobacterium tumefaciens]MBP2568176.1 hypothetical protein [Agrobacterium tumefaciens]MDR6705146.1 hypothetical protein [Agrobacterium tumefaciens]